MALYSPLLVLLATLPTLFFPFTLAISSTGLCSAPPDHDSTLHILPTYSPCSPLQPSTPPSRFLDTLLFLSNRDVSRFSYLSSLLAAAPTSHRSFVPIASGRNLLQSSTYVARASLGTPPQPLLVALDISSDAAWFPCSSCSGCTSSSAFFSPNRSSSFLSLPCNSPQCTQLPNRSCPAKTCTFNLTYGAASISSALSQDSLSLAADSINSYTFGCVVSASGGSIPPQGLLGLGRGPLSFLSQTKNLYFSTFSYCLPGFRSPNFAGTLRLGPSGQPKRIRTTPLLSNPHRPSLYYVNMTAIRVGRKRLLIPPAALAFNPSTGAGTIFDSGTMFTRLVSPAYTAVRDEFRRRVNSPVTSLGGFDTCYNGSVVLPTITFEFDGMNMTLSEENTVIHSSSGTLSCLAMASAPDNVNSVLNVIASMQQQNHRVVFDLPNGRVGVSREPCTS
ncbi:aspartyl protease AED3-like [Dendrobium catenatum]|uniref:Aspartic proteinase nepenthesin-1 n=1 Tax=Dendrobium catenatum TaxID=906689 RepID=A0A2I0VCS1_9ASPA|nr:aspartyl protease AED3-like [Dendrobium catenatum]PKU61205.1 Aspartic proteinase nepenthesin-1 [Dendrobium catenatum]